MELLEHYPGPVLKDATTTAHRICSEARSLLLKEVNDDDTQEPESLESPSDNELTVLEDLLEQYKTPIHPLDSNSNSYTTTYGADFLVMSAYYLFRTQRKLSVELTMHVQLYIYLYTLLGLDYPNVHEFSKRATCAIDDDFAGYLGLCSNRRFHSQSEFPVKDEVIHNLEEMIHTATATRFDACEMSGMGIPTLKITRHRSIRHYMACVETPPCSRTLLSHVPQINQCDSICRKTRFVDIMAHLYSACRRSEDLEVEWRDMAFAIHYLGPLELGLARLDIHIEKGMGDYMGALSPDSGRQRLLTYCKRFGIAMGVSEKQYSRSPQLAGSISNVPGQRLKLHVALTVNWDAYQSEGSRFQATIDKCSAYHRSPTTEGMKRQQATLRLVEQVRKYNHYIVDQGIKDAYDSSSIAGLSDVDELNMVRIISEGDAMSLHSNYRNFLSHCAILLKLIKEQINHLVATAAKRGLPQQFAHREMMNEILWAAAIGAADPQAPAYASGTLLRLAAEVIAETMPPYDSSCYDEARFSTTSGPGEFSTTSTPGDNKRTSP